MDLKNAIKQSCDIYFYDLARRLGVDRLAITAKKYGLGSEILKDFYFLIFFKIVKILPNSCHKIQFQHKFH